MPYEEVICLYAPFCQYKYHYKFAKFPVCRNRKAGFESWNPCSQQYRMAYNKLHVTTKRLSTLRKERFIQQWREA